jgi:hypothetical protein
LKSSDSGISSVGIESTVISVSSIISLTDLKEKDLIALNSTLFAYFYTTSTSSFGCSVEILSIIFIINYVVTERIYLKRNFKGVRFNETRAIFKIKENVE